MIFINKNIKPADHVALLTFKMAQTLRISSMQAWSITYHSWLTFVLLLWACLIWITPFARWFCMVSSPYLVFYAECLLIIQYIYGMDLNDSELPVKHANFEYSEWGLKKFYYPCLHLGAQVQNDLLFPRFSWARIVHRFF